MKSHLATSFALCLAVLSGCESPRATSRRVVNFEIPGTLISEIHTEFIGRYDEVTTRVWGRVHLLNEAVSGRQFPIFELFPLQVHVSDSFGQQLSRRDGAINPIVKVITIESSQAIDQPFDFVLRDCFELKPGTLKLEFVYDFRLQNLTNGVLPWSKYPMDLRYQP